MRPLSLMDTIQIEVTNACPHDCSNCTRFCGHIKTPFMMSFDKIKQAVDSLSDFPQMVGIMGGEPLLHPKFEEICEYALSKIPRERLGLWTAFPPGKEKYAATIEKTFQNIFLNDHSLSGIYHAPILVNPFETIIPDDHWKIWAMINNCWVQNSWSASINPYGAYFCEIAAAMAMLFHDPATAWPCEAGWWKKTPKDFAPQIEHWCSRCGCAINYNRRESIDGRDDVSPKMFEALKGISRKLDKCIVGTPAIVDQPQQMAAYKDMGFRQSIAARYGMYLTITPQGFWEPHIGTPRKTLFDQYKEQYEQNNRPEIHNT